MLVQTRCGFRQQRTMTTDKCKWLEVSSKLSREAQESATDEGQMKKGRQQVAEYKAEVDVSCNKYVDLRAKVANVSQVLKEKPTPDTIHIALSEMATAITKDVAAAVGHRQSAGSEAVRSDRIEWTTAAMCPNSRAVQDGASFLQHGESHRPYKALSSSWGPLPNWCGPGPAEWKLIGMEHCACGLIGRRTLFDCLAWGDGGGRGAQFDEVWWCLDQNGLGGRR